MGKTKDRKKITVYIMLGVMLASAMFGTVKKAEAGSMGGFPAQNTSDYITRYTRALQVMLVSYNTTTRAYIIGSGGADGSFGPATKNAVENFQQNEGLSVDGNCGPLTWSKFYTKLISLGSDGSFVYFKGPYPYTGIYCMRHTPNYSMTWYTYWEDDWYYVD